MEAGIVSLRTGRVAELPRPNWERGRAGPWRSAYVKHQAPGPVRATALGLEGDEQFDRRVHGGPDMAVLAYADAHYPSWRAETGIGEMGPGGFGENLTLSGVDETSVCVGDTWRCDEVVLEVSQPRGPCANISRRWNVPTLQQRVTDRAWAGWYLRVLREGLLASGATLTLASRPHPEWSVERVFRLRYDPALDPAAVRWLSGCAALSATWRQRFAEQAVRLG